ncbi:unnamed protein product, partial [Rotaria magnacalcarata]
SLLDELRDPTGFFIDNAGNIYVTDNRNIRIVKWKPRASSGQVVAGGNCKDYLLENDVFMVSYLLNSTSSNIVLDNNRTMFICDRGNLRVQRWFQNDNQDQTIIANISCAGVNLDNQGFLYVTDEDGHRVIKYPGNEIVAGGNEAGSVLNQIWNPGSIYLDRNHSVFVADIINDRVVIWPAGVRESLIVAGGNGQGNGTHQLQEPHAVLVDYMGTVYVADTFNSRIVRWLPNSQSGVIIIDALGANLNGKNMFIPVDMAFDRKGNLYVADIFNNRILMFPIGKSSCVTSMYH